MLNTLISIFGFKKSLKASTPDITDSILKKQASKEQKRIKNEIKKIWKKVCIVVTPICDFAQKKNINDRVVKGILIPKEYRDYIEDKSEAVLIIPFVIELDGSEYYLALDFRYFITTDLTQQNVTGLFRIRQEMLAEVQSKLSRHINRLGILIIDER